MSNLFKGWFVSVDDENTREVDSNEMVERRIREEEEKRSRLAETDDADLSEEGEFVEGLSAESIDALTSEDAEAAVIKSADREEQARISEELENAKAELEAVKQEAAQTIENAQNEAEALKQSIFEQAKEEGYNAGVAEGMASVEALKKEAEDKAIALEAEYQQKLTALEPEFIDALTDIYEHIFKVDLESYRGIVEQLLTDTINSTDGGRNIIVHISKDDYQDIIDKKDAILTETGMTSDNVEFVQDATLGSASCMIETENGVYDCSLETELKELKRKLMLLSYHRE